MLLIPSFCFCQEVSKYEEITVFLNVQGVGGSEAPALIKGKVAYLSISDVFTLLKIKNKPSTRLDSLSGFFINQQDKYLIDRVKNQIVFQGKKIELKTDDLILTETNLYMKTSLFGEVFGLNCAFSFRDISVKLTTKLELPLIRELKMDQMRENLKRLKGEVKTDTTIGISYPLFKFGMADWSINNSQQQGFKPTTQLNLGLGTVVAGAEMNAELNYDQANQFDLRQQTYLWRYANNDHKALRQVLIGKIMPQAISTLNGSLIGIQLTNTPTIYRQSFGTYTLSNTTQPEWLVELYVNNVLVDFVKADASGFYKFEVPLVYGNSVMMVRMYGPWGEVQTRIENANIPFNFLPTGELEYNVSAGVVEDKFNTKFSRTNVNYGVSRRMSIGGGYEYISSPEVVSSLPFINSSLMLFNDLMIAGDYSFGVRLKTSLSYRLSSDVQLDLNYTGYEKNQKAIRNAPLQERGVSVAVPIQVGQFSSYSRISLMQTTYTDYKTTNAILLFSANLFGVSSNVTTAATFSDLKHINANSSFSLSFRLPGKFTLMPSLQYDYSQQRVVLMRFGVDKPLFGRGYLNIAYQRNFIDKVGSLEVGLRYDFSFMQSGVNSRFSNRSNTFSQTANGSLLFDKKSKYIGTSKTGTVGRGGLIFMTFLDLNGNGKKDKEEPKLLGLNLRINGGRMVRSNRDSTIRVFDLTPYTSYLVELDKNSFQSISWQIKKLTLSVYADPNQIKMIEVPVAVMGEASGTINVKANNNTKGLGRIYVCFYRNNQTLVGRTLSEMDGYFSFMGLPPGKYAARVDSSQLTKIRMTASPELKWFKVKQSKEGDFVEGLDFTLKANANDSVKIVSLKVVPKTFNSFDSTFKIINYVLVDDLIINVPNKGIQFNSYYSSIRGINYLQGVPIRGIKDWNGVMISNIYVKPILLIVKPDPLNILILDKDTLISIVKEQQYNIQVGAYSSKTNALSEQQKITVASGRPVIVVLKDCLYKLWIVGFADRQEAERLVMKLARLRIKSNVIKSNNLLLLGK